MTKQKKQTVIIGMSGGVDSSVSALLLKREGYHVEGLFMKNWEEENEEHNCSASQDLIDAQSVCLKLGIRLHTVNFSEEYWDRVFTYFLEEYKAGRTPNPDVMCNKEIKFNAFLNHALVLGADWIATGHYARCKKDEVGYHLLKGTDKNKDQSYFLYLLSQHQLKKTLFPIGKLEKHQIRHLAKEAQFKNCNKKDSTGICFIGERKFKTFLKQYLPAQPGKIETLSGKVIGQHDGLMYYTIGQRQGIGIGGRKDSQESPWYVFKKDLQRNILIVGQDQNHPALSSTTLQANQLHWINYQPTTFPYSCRAKIRYRQADQTCTIEKIDNEIATVTFDHPQRAITPGQSVVFYQQQECLGGGVVV